MLHDLIIVVILSAGFGFFLGYLSVRVWIPVIEHRSRAELETWKRETEGSIRKDSVSRSRSTLKGKIAEQMAPVLPGFGFNPADARFIGSPVDYVIFDGLSRIADEQGCGVRIVFMDVKQGTSAGLTRTQRLIRQAVEEKRIGWQTLRIPDTACNKMAGNPE